MVKRDITKIMSSLFLRILYSFGSNYLLVYMIWHVLWLESFGYSHSDVYCQVVKIESSQPKFHEIHISKVPHSLFCQLNILFYLCWYFCECFLIRFPPQNFCQQQRFLIRSLIYNRLAIGFDHQWYLFIRYRPNHKCVISESVTCQSFLFLQGQCANLWYQISS